MNAPPVLLGDDEMQRFIRDGYIELHPEFPCGFHAEICSKLDSLFSEWGNPYNNVLPCLPELADVFSHPVVDGALCSILGHDYYLHLHRHVHDWHPGSDAQSLHKDSLCNSRNAVDENRRHHRTRWAMAFYYPQDTPLEMGPTAIFPRSQYLNGDRPEGVEEIPLTGKPGSVIIVHYDLLHKATRHAADALRYMVKFLFTRMTEPEVPSWDCLGGAWIDEEDPQNCIWRHVWDWHCGTTNGSPRGIGSSVADLAGRLGSKAEVEALQASYELGLRGEEAVPVLLDALRSPSEDVRRNAAYAFTGMGATEASILMDTAADTPADVRARLYDVLGDMGLCAEPAVGGLISALEDDCDDARSRAAEALGTAGQRCDGLAAPLAERLEKDRNEEVRRNAALSLSRLGPRARGSERALEKGTRDESHYVRGYSVNALDRMETRESRDVLVRQLQTVRWDWDTPGRRTRA